MRGLQPQDSGNHTQNEATQALPEASKLPKPPTALTAASASRKPGGRGGCSRKGTGRAVSGLSRFGK